MFPCFIYLDIILKMWNQTKENKQILRLIKETLSWTSKNGNFLCRVSCNLYVLFFFSIIKLIKTVFWIIYQCLAVCWICFSKSILLTTVVLYFSCFIHDWLIYWLYNALSTIFRPYNDGKSIKKEIGCFSLLQFPQNLHRKYHIIHPSVNT